MDDSILGGGEQCRCPPGYGRDFTIFHDENCALPDDTLLIFFIEYSSLVVLLILAVWYNGGKRRHRSFTKLVRFVVLCLFCSMMFSMALWLERGMFHGSLVAVCFYIWSFLRSIMEVTGLVFSSASSIVESRPFTKRYRRIVARTAALFEIALISCVVALLVLCQSQQYNLVLGITMLIIAMFNIVLIVFILREIRRLLVFAKRECMRMPSGNEVLLEKWKDFSWRMKMLRVSVATYSAIFVVGTISLPIIHFILGSAPFSWCFLLAAVHVVYLACGAIFFFLRQPMDSARHSFFAVGENMDSEEATAYRGVFGMRTPIIKGRLHLSVGRLALSSRAPTANDTHVETYESAA